MVDQPYAFNEMDDFAVCKCGDYRHQHDNRGCKICRELGHSFDRPFCPAFRLAGWTKPAITTSRTEP